MNALKNFINQRSQREILLFKILWIVGIFYVCFEYFAYPELMNSRAYKLSLNSCNQSKEIEQSLQRFNQTSLPYTQILSMIQSHIPTLTKIQSSDEKANYKITLEGKYEPNPFLALLYSIASPSLLITSFSLHSDGYFSLDLKNQKILSLPSFPLENLPFKNILQRFQTPSTPRSFVFYSLPRTKLSFSLEAIMNHKAKINGVWLKSGEMIEGYMLKNITPYGVILSKDFQTISLYLKERRILR